MKDQYKILISLFIITVMAIFVQGSGILTNQMNITYDAQVYARLMQFNSTLGDNYFYNAKTNKAGPMVFVYDASATNDDEALSLLKVGAGITTVSKNNVWGVNTNFAYLNWVIPANEYQYAGYFGSSLGSSLGHPTVMIQNTNKTNPSPVLVVDGFSATETTPLQSWRNQTNQVAYVSMNGSFYGAAFIDSTPGFEGSALDAVKTVKTKDGKLDDAKMNPFMQGEWRIPVMEEVVVEVNGEPKTMHNVVGYETKTGRNIGNTVTVNSMAIQELVEELCKHDNTYKFC